MQKAKPVCNAESVKPLRCGSAIGFGACKCGAQKKLPEEEPELAPEDNGQEKVGFLETIKFLLQNKYYVRLLFVGIFYKMIMNITSAVGIYYMRTNRF